MIGLQDYLPSGIAWSAGRIEDKQGGLWAVELMAVAAAVPKRQAEFRAGRTCAREALALLGRPHMAIPAGENRAPFWPSGIVGSIAHSEIWAAAVVARNGDYAGLGIDLEPDAPLKPGLYRMVVRPDERNSLPPTLLLGAHAVDVGKALFAIKEAIFKAVYPLVGAMFYFQDARVVVDGNSGRYSARIDLPEGTECPFGEWLVAGSIGCVAGHVVATAIVPATAGP